MKKGYIPASKFYPVIIDDNATDQAIIDVYNAIKNKIKRGKRNNNDSTICTSKHRRTS